MTEGNLAHLIKAVEAEDSQVANVEETLSSLKNSGSLSLQCISQLGMLLEGILKKAAANKKKNDEYRDWLKRCYEIGAEALEKTCTRTGTKEQRVAAFKTMLNLLSLYNDAFHAKPMFPHEQYGTIIRILMTSETDISSLLPHLKEAMHFEDIKKNVWRAIEIAIQMDRLPVVKELRHILQILGLVEAAKTVVIKGHEEPVEYYSGTKVGILGAKETDKCIRRIWDRLKLVKVEKDVKQLLLLALLEKMMPRMEKPIFLTDYFMQSLEEGGAVGVLSLQGIFDLVLKYNINYPDVYQKLYSMFTPELFQTSYKSRFYHLSNLFLSSTMLPESLVAGYIKRLARLALVAPPGDILVLLDFIKNLMVRHPNLKVLFSRPDAKDMDSDPYLPDEPNPSDSRALESTLWEIRLLQDHVNPTVNGKAFSFCLPKQDTLDVEVDLSHHFDTNYQTIFEKCLEHKVNEPPLSFERPSTTFLNKPTTKQAFSAWE